MVAGITDKERGQRETHKDEAKAQIEWLWADAVTSCNPTGRKSAGRDSDIASELVEPHRETALFRADEVNLHDHRRRPREALAHTQQEVCEEHPIPRRRPHQ